MKIYVGTDHNGFRHKQKLVEYLKRAGYEVVDVGHDELVPDDDFPEFAHRTVLAMLASDDPDPRGILLCGSGQGMCMAANRFNGIRAALGYDHVSARVARNDDDSNVLCIPARHIKSDETNLIVDTWLNTPFAGAPRFKRRIRQMDELRPGGQ